MHRRDCPCLECRNKSVEFFAGFDRPSLTIPVCPTCGQFDAAASVPLSAETEGLRELREWLRDEAEFAHQKGWNDRAETLIDVEAKCDDLKLLAAPTVAQAPTRCPYCSFDPTSMNDYCAEHRPARREAPEGAAPAVSREASVPQVGELERVRLRLIALWGDPEDCEDCAVIESRPCRVHANWENGE
jgi:hypothetical protein